MEIKEIIKDYTRFLHVPTLLLVAGFQLMMYFFVVSPFLASYNVQCALSGTDLTLLVLATVFIAMGGFVVNDYFDLKIDQINHPITRFIGRRMDKHTAMTLYIVLTGIGVFFAILLCWHARSLDYGLVLMFVAGILWFYSSSYKRMLVLGNVLVALLMALVPLTVAVFQNRFMALEYRMTPDLDFLMMGCLRYTGAFALLAFGWTFLIEVIKDLATEKGDRELECHTFPVVWGIKKTKWLIYGWITLMWALSGWFIYTTPELRTMGSLRFYVCGMLIPAFSLYYIVSKARSASDYRLIKNYIMAIFAINIIYSCILEF